MPALALAQSPLAPQKARSLSGLMQAAPHCTWLARHEVAQAPLAQTSPWLQLLPALALAQSPLAPQKARSLSGLTQPPPQKSWPAGQEGAQRPA